MNNNLSIVLSSAVVVSLLVSVVLLPVYGEDGLSPGEEGIREDAQQSTTSKNRGQSGLVEKEASEPMQWRNEVSGQLYANSSLRFILESTDNLSRTDYIEYKINDGNFLRYEVPLGFSNEGAYNIAYRSFDRAGNREANHSFSVVIDNTPPDVVVTPSKAFVEVRDRLFTSPGNTFTIRAADYYSGIKKIVYGINTEPTENYVVDSTIQLSDPGPQVIKYKAVDRLNNTSEVSSVLVEVDNSLPQINIRPTQSLRQIDSDSYARRDTGFVLVAEDQGSGVSVIQMRLDGASEWQTYADTLYFSTEKRHSIDAKAVDFVGNESEIVTLSFTVDDNPPVTKVRTSVELKQEKR